MKVHTFLVNKSGWRSSFDSLLFIFCVSTLGVCFVFFCETCIKHLTYITVYFKHSQAMGWQPLLLSQWHSPPGPQIQASFLHMLTSSLQNLVLPTLGRVHRKLLMGRGRESKWGARSAGGAYGPSRGRSLGNPQWIVDRALNGVLDAASRICFPLTWCALSLGCWAHELVFWMRKKRNGSLW